MCFEVTVIIAGSNTDYGLNLILMISESSVLGRNRIYAASMALMVKILTNTLVKNEKKKYALFLPAFWCNNNELNPPTDPPKRELFIADLSFSFSLSYCTGTNLLPFSQLYSIPRIPATRLRGKIPTFLLPSHSHIGPFV